MFFKKLAHGDIELHFQSVKLLNIKVDYAAKNSCRSSLVNVMEGIGGELWEAFINWSSFQKEFIDLSVAETVMDVDSEDLLSWDDTVRADYISRYQKQLFTKIQTGLFGEIPGPVLDCLDFPYGRAAIYLYSEKIIKYLEFAADNKDIIHNQFAREHERIRRALRIVEQPVAREWVKSHVKKGRYYIIGFYIGEDIEHGITFRHLTTISCAKWQNFSTCTVAIRSHIFMQFIAMKMRLRISNRTGRIFVLCFSGLSGLGTLIGISLLHCMYWKNYWK